MTVAELIYSLKANWDMNDEVIVKLINDSNTLLKCMKDCYNLLDSQRRAKE